jgi:predicted phage tail protein
VAAGTTYYYVVRSVNSSGTESANSNQATAAVPTP